MKRIAIFASGSGSNYENIIQHILDDKITTIEVVSVYTDNHEAFVIERARKYNTPVNVFEYATFDNKIMYEKALIKQLEEEKIEWIVLAGYMRLIGETLLEAYEGRIINIHPSLLPSFPGKNAASQALQYGVKYTGATVHFVDSGMDTGKIIDQMICPVDDNDTDETLQQRIHTLEYELYPRVINNIIK